MYSHPFSYVNSLILKLLRFLLFSGAGRVGRTYFLVSSYFTLSMLRFTRWCYLLLLSIKLLIRKTFPYLFSNPLLLYFHPFSRQMKVHGVPKSERDV